MIPCTTNHLENTNPTSGSSMGMEPPLSALQVQLSDLVCKRHYRLRDQVDCWFRYTTIHAFRLCAVQERKHIGMSHLPNTTSLPAQDTACSLSFPVSPKSPTHPPGSQVKDRETYNTKPFRAIACSSQASILSVTPSVRENGDWRVVILHKYCPTSIQHKTKCRATIQFSCRHFNNA